jgi:hypothetical protein
MRDTTELVGSGCAEGRRSKDEIGINTRTENGEVLFFSSPTPKQVQEGSLISSVSTKGLDCSYRVLGESHGAKELEGGWEKDHGI